MSGCWLRNCASGLRQRISHRHELTRAKGAAHHDDASAVQQCAKRAVIASYRCQEPEYVEWSRNDANVVQADNPASWMVLFDLCAVQGPLVNSVNSGCWSSAVDITAKGGPLSSGPAYARTQHVLDRRGGKTISRQFSRSAWSRP